MDVQLIRSENLTSKNWSGGTTTELFIYPPNANYQDRNFDFRLSTATVEIEKSEFTPLPNISRTLLVLEGSMKLYHENHHSKTLNKFDSDFFMGGWKTRSVGKCRDFNLMTTGSTNGELEPIILTAEKKLILDRIDKWTYCIIYLLKGKIESSLGNENHINESDVLVINNPKENQIEIMAIEDAELVIARISLQKS